MAKDRNAIKRGRVVEALPGLKFRVEMFNNSILFCHLSGKMIKNNIRIVPGDAVDVIVSPDGRLGRIDYRL